MLGLLPWQQLLLGSQRLGGGEEPLLHADAAWERRGLLGRLPTHPALLLDPLLYKGRIIP